jgi:hypothetical protein
LKKSLSIWLLVVLIAPAVLAVSWLHFEKRQVKREVKWNMIAGLDNEELVLLKFTQVDSAKLRWEHDREFEHQGEMYDIVERQIKGDTTYYYCWWDHEETKLNQKLQSLLAEIWQSNSNKKEQEEHLIALYKSLFISNEIVCETASREDLAHYAHYLYGVKKREIPPPVPPPNI